MIYDCFTFFNEFDLLELRLEELDKIVDRFVLVEATKTFSNKPKPLYYAENKERYRKFHHKIIHIIVDDLPEHPKDHWENQYIQRNAIARGLTGCKADDIILISDIDEIPRPSVIREFNGEIALLEQNFYYYRLNCICSSHKWQIPAILRYRNLTTPQEIRDIWYKPELKQNVPIICNAGWHFSYLGDVDKIVTKIESISGQEYNTATFKDRNKIRHKIKHGTDLFDRPDHAWAYTVIDDTYPKYLLEHIGKFQKYIDNYAINRIRLMIKGLFLRILTNR